MAAHIRLLIQITESEAGDPGSRAAGPAKVLRTSRRYTHKAPTAGDVWLARLAAEKRFAASAIADEGASETGSDGRRREARAVVEKAWKEARGAVVVRSGGSGLDEAGLDVVWKVWMWGLESPFPEDTAEDRRRIHEVRNFLFIRKCVSTWKADEHCITTLL